MSQTFSQFKSDFYARVPDLSLFDCGDINLLKIVLDGLKVNYLKRGIYVQDIFEPKLKLSFLLLAKRIKYHTAIRTARAKCQSISRKLNVRYLLLDTSRVAKDARGRDVSFYFNKIEPYLGKENCFTIFHEPSKLKTAETVVDLHYATLFSPYSKSEKEFIGQLKQTYSVILGSGIFNADELFNIRVAINKFFAEFKFWHSLLKNATVKIALFEEHYHREGMILALKQAGVKTFELQHGLIAPEDIFYVFPPQVKKVAHKALFPDKIFTFGHYWSNILLQGSEFAPAQIEVLGSYQEINSFAPAEQEKELDEFLKGDPFILVTTQTFLHAIFIEYVLWLSKHLSSTGSPVKIVVKNHPAEVESYNQIRSLENVAVFNFNTEYLLKRCKWHVSGYSTTLYDALKYDCENFSLFIEACMDYINTFINEGISTLIYNSQSPVSFDKTVTQIKFDKSTLYEDFDLYKHKLKELPL